MVSTTPKMNPTCIGGSATALRAADMSTTLLSPCVSCHRRSKGVISLRDHVPLSPARGHAAVSLPSTASDDDRVCLEEWSFAFNASRPLQLTGRIFNNSSGYEDGDLLEYTSQITSISGRTAVTKSGTVYKLGRPSAHFERLRTQLWINSRTGALGRDDGSSVPPLDEEQPLLGIKLGEIPQPPKTYNVMGNANEQGLAIGETTHGGLSVLSNVGKTSANGTIMDYNNLISVTLQRASTAREAIKTMAWLANTYGYASDMEGFSIADSDEVWYMELIGKGSFEKGVVWVALRVPDGYVSAHANQARITTFLPCDDPSACMAAPDAASFAIKHGLWSGKPDDPAFSFSDVYDPLTFEGLRFCEARVWYIFSQIADPSHFDAQAFLPYARGANASARMPLFVKPKAKLSRHRIHELMGSHYEGSWFDPSKDVGAGAEHVGWLLYGAGNFMVIFHTRLSHGAGQAGAGGPGSHLRMHTNPAAGWPPTRLPCDERRATRSSNWRWSFTSNLVNAV